MKAGIEAFESDMTFNHLPYGIRFIMHLNRIKYRIMIFVTLFMLFSYWGNMLGIAGSRIERLFKKYKKRWIYKNHRTSMTYESANETQFEPKHLSRSSTD